MCLDLCFRVNVYLKVQFDQFINWTTQVLRKRRAIALANGSLGLLHKAHDSPKGLEMDRLMEGWTDGCGDVSVKEVKK